MGKEVEAISRKIPQNKGKVARTREMSQSVAGCWCKGYSEGRGWGWGADMRAS